MLDVRGTFTSHLATEKSCFLVDYFDFDLVYSVVFEALVEDA